MTQLRTLLNAAFETARRGYYSDARNEFEFILKHDPRSIEALYGMAACSYRLKEYARSLDELDLLLRLNPRHADALGLRDTVRREELTDAASGGGETFQFPSSPREAFGEGDSEAVIPEWAPIPSREPTFRDLQQSEGDRLFGPFSIGKAFRTARVVNRRWRGSLYGTGFLALIVQTGVLTVLLRFLVPKILDGKSEFNVLLSLVACFLFLLVLPLNTFHAFQVLIEGSPHVTRRQSLVLLERWPKMVSAYFFANIPLLVSLILLVGPRDVLSPLDAGGLRPAFYVLLGVIQAYLWVRTWFLGQITGLEGIGGMQAVLRAWYGTSGKTMKTATFALLQILSLPLALLPLAAGYPKIGLRQAEAYRSIYREEEPEAAMNRIAREAADGEPGD